MIFYNSAINSANNKSTPDISAKQIHLQYNNIIRIINNIFFIISNTNVINLWIHLSEHFIDYFIIDINTIFKQVNYFHYFIMSKKILNDKTTIKYKKDVDIIKK